MVNIFMSFAEEDQALVKAIKKVTKPWVRRQKISIWDKGTIGVAAQEEAFEQMRKADIILLCFSIDFVDSERLHEQMKFALELRAQQQKLVIPVLLKEYDLEQTPFKGITPLPSSRVPLASHRWPSLDDALYQLSKDLESVILRMEAKKQAQATAEPTEAPRPPHQYQVGLSFAGEDRAYVEQVAEALKNRHISLFYDAYEEAALWGEDLYQHLNRLYKERCRYTIIFISRHYARKLWTRHELKAAQARAFTENRAYILPVRLDDTELPGLNSTVLYQDARVKSPEDIANLVWRKIQGRG